MIKNRNSAFILGARIDVTQEDEVLSIIADSLKNRKKCSIFTPNPEILVQAYQDPGYLNILNNSTINIPDGKGLIIASWLTKKRIRHVVRGRELMVKLLTWSNANHKKVCFLGATLEVNRKATERALKEYPNLEILGIAGPVLDNEAKPVTEVDSKIYKDTLRDIDYFAPDILFVAFGAPKQEKWIARNFQNSKAFVSMGVGGALDYYAGAAKLPPEWVSRLGLEWAWRLIQNPSRIRRILNATVVFPYYVIISLAHGTKN